MSKDKLLELVERIAGPVAASLGLSVWGVELLGMGRPVIKISLERAQTPVAGEEPEASLSQDGVSIDECADVSRLVGLALEVEDIFPDTWTLEVSSPGLERTFFRLEQMSAYAGNEIDVVLWEPLPEFAGRRKFLGRLTGVDVSGFLLAWANAPAGDAPIYFAWQNIRKVHLVHTFPDTTKPGAGKSGKGGGKKA